MAVANSNFEIGDVVQITEASWEHSSEILHKFNFKKGGAYEVTGVYPSGLISLKGATATYYPDYFELFNVGSTQAIKSDGGSSSYYELTISNKTGESIKVETGDVIRTLVGNDFDFGNCVKALRRMYLATLGMGKEGTDIPYDANKIRWFLGEIERVNK